MRTKQVVFLLFGVFLAVVLAACGGGGGGAETPLPGQPQISVAASENIALADNTDTITITANFTGTPPSDGTPVAFSITSGAAVFSNGTPNEIVNTSGGVASTTVKSSAPGAVTITAVSGNTASTNVKFIAQPTSMKVSIAINPPVTALTTLGFKVINTPGASYSAGTVTTINAASGLFVDAAQPSSDTTNVGFFTGTSLNTGTAPIFELTYAISPGSGLPTVQIADVTSSKLSDPNNPSSPTTPAGLVPENFVVTIKYNTDN